MLFRSQPRIAVFCLFQSFTKKEYQTESKRNETFGNVIFGTNVIQRTWSGHQETNEESTRQGVRPPPRGPLVAQPTYFFLLYISTYTETIQEHQENIIPPPQPSVSARSHLGAFVGAPLEGESTMEGLSITTKASPMTC